MPTSSLGEYEKAIEDFDQAIVIDPNFAAAYYNRELAREALNECKTHWKLVDKALEIAIMK